jgi:hypothetical protein
MQCAISMQFAIYAQLSATLDNRAIHYVKDDRSPDNIRNRLRRIMGETTACLFGINGFNKSRIAAYLA